MSNDDLKYLFEQMLDFIPKDSQYFKNMVKLTKIFKDIDQKIELEEVDDITCKLGTAVADSYVYRVDYEANGFPEECEYTIEDAIVKVIKQFTIDPQFKINQKNNIANCVIEEVDKYTSDMGGSSSGIKNAIKLGASKYINELIERTLPHESN